MDDYLKRNPRAAERPALEPRYLLLFLLMLEMARPEKEPVKE